MRKICLRGVACVATLLICATSCVSANPSSDSFTYSKDGVASVKTGADYTSVSNSCPGLYTRAEFLVCCGGEDGEGVEILYYDDTSSEPVIRAILDMGDAAVEALYQQGLECNSYPIGDSRIADLLKRTGSTRISSVIVAPSPNITVNVGDREIATTDPAVRFMELPGAVMTASLGEGINLTCTVGDLNMTIMNGYEALTSEASSVVGKKLAAAIETGMFEPVTITPANLIPSAHFDYFFYN